MALRLGNPDRSTSYLGWVSIMQLGICRNLLCIFDRDGCATGALRATPAIKIRLARTKIGMAARGLPLKARSISRRLDRRPGLAARRPPGEADRMLLGRFLGRGRVVGLLAFGAKAGEMDGIIRDPKAGAPAVRQGQVVQPRVLEVDHATAPYADQVVMMAGIGVEPGRRAKMVGTPDRAELDQRIRASGRRSRARSPEPAPESCRRSAPRSGGRRRSSIASRITRL